MIVRATRARGWGATVEKGVCNKGGGDPTGVALPGGAGVK